jgi:Predicted dehydrogenases and related proteins
MKSLRFAIIGLGGMGKVHAKNLYAGRVKNVRLAAICDHDPAVLAWAKKEYPDLPLYLNDEEMIEKEPLDAIVVVTPHYSHIQIAI